jgi:hypothetical protein
MSITVSGMSGNELYCLAEKNYWPGEIAVGNSVFSLGIGGAISAFGQTLTGGELSNLSELISGDRPKRNRPGGRAEKPSCRGDAASRSQTCDRLR